ncbi:uncharacterized protein LOC129253708 [Lytechinus pictus]|uniref:uncharacterized protein LOC129253708 n=1 Tax=Lytechinus pictus TaxID=7653 RepID=UPI00240E7E6D|nr:uncharacterized protein LOC129253708 [Lytechinus pictus]
MFMEHFEETALQSATHKPKVWLRYVDDTFVVWQHGAEETSNFLQHLNSQHECIKFTMEMENEGSIPFLDTKLTRTAQGSLSHQVSRKPTHTDRYLNYRSFHHPSVLRSTNKTLVKRAHKVSDQIHLSGQPKARVVLPYLGAASHKIQRILRETDIEVRHSSSNKIQSALTTHKDKRTSKDLPGVYRIPCECGKLYIRETGRSFNIRIKEHKAHGKRDERDKSAIIDHAQTHDHRILWDESRLVTRVPYWHQRRVREVLEIEEQRPPTQQ